jgi:hypothetical protein
MFVLHAIIFKLNPQAPIPLIFNILACCLWAFVFFSLYSLLKDRVARTIAFLIPLGILYIDFFRDYYLGSGVLMSEIYSVPFFILGLCYLSQLNITPLKNKPLIITGVLFAMSAFMRAQFELSIRYFSFIFLLIIAYYFWRFKKTNSPSSFFKSLPEYIKSLGLVLLTFHVVTFPYRLYNKMSWINVDFMYAQQWDTHEHLYKTGIGFGVNGGGATACMVNPEKCKEINTRRTYEHVRQSECKKEVMKTLITHPIAWFEYKAPYLGRYWFFNTKLWQDVSLKEIADNIILTLIFIISIAYLLYAGGLYQYTALFVLSTFGTTFMATYICHVELRYYDLTKLIGLCLSLIALRAWLENKRKLII